MKMHKNYRAVYERNEQEFVWIALLFGFFALFQKCKGQENVMKKNLKSFECLTKIEWVSKVFGRNRESENNAPKKMEEFWHS